MKKLILIVFTAVILGACGNTNQFTLNGEIVPATDGTIILYGFEKGNPVPIDSSAVVEGKFSFKGEVEVPELNLLRIEKEDNYCAQLFIEGGKINITIYSDSLEANTITGSKTQDIFQIYMEEMISFSKSEDELKQRFGNAQATGNEDEMNAVRFEYETMVENTKLYAKNFITEYPKSTVSAYVYLMNFFQEASAEELDSILKVFEPIKKSDFVLAIQERADVLNASKEGAKAPDFTLNDPDGNPVTLSSLKGKFVLVDFWASWCQPCMLEMPNLIEQYNAYKDKGFEIVGVSLDRSREAWVNTIKLQNLNWLHVWDMEGETQAEVATKYGVTGIPHTVLLDKEGNILAKNLRGSDLEAKLAELMN